MKAFVMTAAYKMHFEDRPMPVLKDDNSILVKIKAVGVCGSDLHIYHGTHMLVEYPVVPGHEIVGEVVKVGSSVAELKAGDRVVHENIQWCGKCYPCRKGRHNVCENLKVTGVHHDGGFQEYLVADESKWYKFDENVSYREAVMIEPYTIGAQVIDRGNVGEGDVVLIHGAGPVGLVILDTAKEKGAICICSEVLETRLRLAKEFGADYVINAKNEKVYERIMEITGGKGPNIVIDAAGLPADLGKAVEIISPAGTIVSMNFEFTKFEVVMATASLKELTIVGSRLQKFKFKPVIDSFPGRLDKVDKLITHVFAFEESEKAFEQAAARHPDNGKIIVEF